MTNRIIVKIWTESLEKFDESAKVAQVIEGIVEGIEQGLHILLVTSWAVQFGREALSRQRTQNEDKPLLASIWWDILMSSYRRKFQKYGKTVAGILVTHADIEDSPLRWEVLSRTIFSAWAEWVIPILNENDVLCGEELDALKRGWDNDKNALLLAKMLDSRQLILTTNTNGVYRNPSDPSSRIAEIRSYLLNSQYIDELCGNKSETWTGGMQSKLQVAHEAGKHGISTHIWNGIDSGIHDLYTHGTNIFPYNLDVKF